MANYIEADTLADLEDKLASICTEASLKCELVTGDPIKLFIMPDMSMDGQISMLDEPSGGNGPDSLLTIIFADADVTYKITGDFVISRQLLGKILNLARKIHYMQLWVFYRRELAARRMESME